MNYNVTIVNKMGSTRLYISYVFNGNRKIIATRFPDTKGNRARIEREVIPIYISTLVNRKDSTAIAKKDGNISLHRDHLLLEEFDKSKGIAK